MGVTRAGPGLCVALALAPWATACGNGSALVVEAAADVDRNQPAVRVPYPPPPAKVEVLPLRRRDECLWRDGYWQWQGTSWEWMPGAWVIAPEDCEYVRPETHWEKDNARLVFHPPAWLAAEPGQKCAEPRACSSLQAESQSKPQSGSLEAGPTRPAADALSR